MKNKVQRLETITELLSEEQIGNQDELLHKLVDQGFNLTQATLSRDLKELKVMKAPSEDGKYVYVLPQTGNQDLDGDEAFAVSGYASLDFSGNLAIIKTKPGFANGIASIIDKYATSTIIGTIAGDDTILMVMKEGITKTSVIRDLSKFIPTLI